MTAPGNRRWLDYVPVAEVIRAERNYQGHDDAGLDRSLVAFGFTEPLLLDERTGSIVAGHGRLDMLARAHARWLKLPAKRRAREVPDGIAVDEAGDWLVPITRGWASLSDAHAEAYLLASNELTKRGGVDERLQAQMLTEIDAADPELLAATGWADGELAALLDRLAAAPAPAPDGPGGGGDPGATVSASPPVSAEGDVWLLGPHKLAVGDCTDPAVMRRLMGGADDGLLASLLWTDPPYGVDYIGKTPAALRITSDNADDAPVLFADALEAVRPYLEVGAHFYVCHALDPAELGNRFRELLSSGPWRYKQTLVWVKDRFVLGRSDHHYRHEQASFGRLVETVKQAPDPAARLTAWEGVHALLDEAAGLVRTQLRALSGDGGGPAANGDVPEVLDDAWLLDELERLGGLAYDEAHTVVAYGSLVGRRGRRGRGGGGWYGGNGASTVFEWPRPTSSPDHPTPKPPDLVAAHIRASTRREQLVLDPFAGSGAVLVACEQTDRRARLVELDPAYADGICRRYQALTGRLPVLERTGQTVAFPPLERAA